MLHATRHTALTQHLLWHMPRYRAHWSRVRSIDSGQVASESWCACACPEYAQSTLASTLLGSRCLAMVCHGVHITEQHRDP